MNTFTDTYGNCPQCGQQPSKVFHPTCGDPNNEGCPWGLPKTQGKTFTVVCADPVPDCYGNYPADPLYKGEPVTGVELIAKERHEQFEKHGRTVEDDVRYNSKGQLLLGALSLLNKSEGTPFDDGENGLDHCFRAIVPEDWNPDIFHKMFDKPYKERLIIAGALIAAELDRLLQTELIPFEEVPINKPSQGAILTVSQQQGCKFPEPEAAPRTGRIHYGGYAQHVVHYVIADDTKELIKVSEVSRKIAGDRLVEKQRQMKKDGYDGPFGLPHHCFTFNQAVSFTVDEAGEAVIIF